MNVENVLELLESLKRQHKGTGGGILLRKNGTTTEDGDEETAEKMVGRMLKFQQASSPLVNVALRLLGVQTPLVWVCLSMGFSFFLLLAASPIVVMGLLSFQLWEFVQSTWWGWWRSCCDFAGDGFYAQVYDTVSRFLVDSLASVLWVRNFSAFELWQIAQKFEMLVASGETNGNSDCLNAWLGIRKSRNIIDMDFNLFIWFLNLSVSWLLLMYICLFGCHSLQEISFGNWWRCFWKQPWMWVLTHSSLLQDLLSMWGLGSAQQSTELVKQPGLCRGFSISAWRTRKRFTTGSVLLPGA